MRTVISIEYKEKRISKANKPYTITHVILDDGLVAEFYGDDIHTGSSVEVFLHWGKIKCRYTLT